MVEISCCDGNQSSVVTIGSDTSWTASGFGQFVERIMAATVDPKVIETTKERLGGIIKKPALTDKLLNRPPFKFLHDVIVNVSTCSPLSFSN